MRVSEFSLFIALNAIYFFHLIVIENTQVLNDQFSNLFGENILVKFVSVLLFSIKVVKPIGKYPHINESYAYLLLIFALIILFFVIF